jgi:hypothetical protein
LFTFRELKEGGLLEEGEGKGQEGKGKEGRKAAAIIVSNVGFNTSSGDESRHIVVCCN